MSPTTRLATATDIAEVVRLRRVLFESLGEVGDGWEEPCAAVLRTALEEGWLLAAVIDRPEGGGLAAVGTAEIQQRLPGPTNGTGRLGYLSTMVTDPAHRRRGLASAVLARLLGELERRGVERVELHATPPAEPMYRAAGFGARPGGVEMRLVEG